MDSYIKSDSKMIFVNDIFETDEYFSSYLQKKIRFGYPVKIKIYYLASIVRHASIDCLFHMLYKSGKISGKDHPTNYLEYKNEI